MPSCPLAKLDQNKPDMDFNFQNGIRKAEASGLREGESEDQTENLASLRAAPKQAFVPACVI